MMAAEILPVCEMFTSWQGEGMLAGAPAVFVRLAGCHLRCRFCDTRYAWDASAADMKTADALAAEIVRMGETPAFPEILEACAGGETLEQVSRVTHVVITGGEPALFPAVVPLTETLRKRGFHITIETSGTHYLPAACDLWSLSPKLANAAPDETRHPAEHARHTAACVYAADTLKRFMETGAYQLKFVVGTPADMPEILAFLARFPFLRRECVMLMAQGKTPEEIRAKEAWLPDAAKTHGFRISPRAHLFWFGAAGRY